MASSLTVNLREALAAKEAQRSSPPSSRPTPFAPRAVPEPAPVPKAEPTLVSGRPETCQYARCELGPDGGPAPIRQTPGARARLYCCDDHRVRASAYRWIMSKGKGKPPSQPPPPPAPPEPANEVESSVKKKRKRTVYDPVFIKKCVERVLDGGETQVAVLKSEPGLRSSNISQWVAKETARRKQAGNGKRAVTRKSNGAPPPATAAATASGERGFELVAADLAEALKRVATLKAELKRLL